MFSSQIDKERVYLSTRTNYISKSNHLEGIPLGLKPVCENHKIWQKPLDAHIRIIQGTQTKKPYNFLNFLKRCGFLHFEEQSKTSTSSRLFFH